MSIRGPVRALLGAAVLAVGVSCHRAPSPAQVGLGFPTHRILPLVETFAGALVSADGRPIRIEVDTFRFPPATTYQAAEVGRAARLAAQADMVGVVGHSGSRETLMSAPIYDAAHQPFLAAMATSRRLRSAGPWVFQLAPDDSVEGEYIGRFVADRLRARSVTIFYVVDEYGIGLRDGLVAALGARHIAVRDTVPVGTRGACPMNQPLNAYRATVDAALARGVPDAIVLATRQVEAACIVNQVRHHLPAARFVAGDGLLANNEFFELVGRSADSVYIAAFWHPDSPDSTSRDFVQRFRTRFPGETPDYSDAMIYDALTTMVEALRAVGSDREQVRRFLVSLGHERPALNGVTGPITFPARADRLLMTRVRGMGLVLVPFP